MLHKGLENNGSDEEKRLILRNLETMTAKQIANLGLTQDSNKYETKLKKLEMEATFWTNIDNRIPNFPEKQFLANVYGETDSILSRSLTIKEIYNEIYRPTEHLASSMK